MIEKATQTTQKVVESLKKKVSTLEALQSVKVQIAGWISFIFSIIIACDSLLYMRFHNTSGSYVALGFATAFLSFSAAAFGISSFKADNASFKEKAIDAVVDATAKKIHLNE